MKRRYTIVGGLAVFAAFGFWLAGRDIKRPTAPVDTTGRTVYFGPIDAPVQVTRCRESAIVKVGYNKYVWRCLAADTLLVGNLHFTFYDGADREIDVLLLGLDGRDVYGARYYAAGDSVAVRAVDRVVLP
jgi:hypothetical protein